MRQAGGLLSHPDALQVNGKEHQFLVRELLADILRNAAGAFVVFAAITGDRGAEHFVVGIVFLLLFSLKYALRKKRKCTVKRLKSSASRSKRQL